LSRFLVARGDASDAGKSTPHPVQQSRRLTVPKFRFFETTGLAILTALIQRYRVETHPRFAGDSFEQLKERYSQAKGGLTLT